MKGLNHEIIELMEAMGFEHESYDDNQKKHRFSKGDYFIDIWNGKKNMTIGAYHPLSKKVSYDRCSNMAHLEIIVTQEMQMIEG